MRIACLGGGPAGLYFAISMKLRDPAHEIDLFERNRADDTFGWGVVFSDQTVENLMANDPVSGAIIADEFAHWDDIDVHIHGETIRSSGHGFIGIGRKRLLEHPAGARPRARRRTSISSMRRAPTSPTGPDYDLVIAADGANSRIRDRYAGRISASTSRCAPTGSSGSARTRCSTPSPSPSRRPRRAGSGPTPIASTTISRPSSSRWTRRPGPGSASTAMDQPEAIALVRADLRQISRRPRADVQRHAPAAARRRGSTSAGSSATRWASRQADPARRRRPHRPFLDRLGHQARARGCDQARRGAEPARPRPRRGARRISGRAQPRGAQAPEQRPQLDRMVRDARPLSPFRADPVRLFAAHPLAAGQPRESAPARPGLARRASSAGSSRRRAGRAVNEPAPPMFAPFRLRELELANRVVVSPMAMYSAEDGTPNDFHLVHYGARAQGGAGLVFTEMTCVSPEGRITPGLHRHVRARACRGLAADRRFRPRQQQGEILPPARPFRAARARPRSAGRAMTCRWRAAIGRSSPPRDVPWSPDNQVPRPMTRADMDEVSDQFVAAVRHGARGGLRHGRAPRRPRLSAVELHHPAAEQARPTNMAAASRTACAFRSKCSRAMREAWPADRPMSVRISANDWVGERRRHARTRRS